MLFRRYKVDIKKVLQEPRMRIMPRLSTILYAKIKYQNSYKRVTQIISIIIFNSSFNSCSSIVLSFYVNYL